MSRAPFEVERDVERASAGWGEWGWVVNCSTKERLELLPIDEAMAVAARLNLPYRLGPHGSGRRMRGERGN